MANFENIISSSAGIISLVGVYLIILSHQKKYEIEHTLRKGKVAEGTVTELSRNQGDVFASGDPEGEAPVVEFQTDNGLYIHHSSTYRLPSPYHVGQKVKIYYYIYKSRREFALEDDMPGTFPDKMKKWGIMLCLLGIPILLLKLRGLF